MLTKDNRRTFARLRSEGFAAPIALHYARIIARWEALEHAGLVRMTREPDNEPSHALDMEWGTGRAAEAARKALAERIERDGVWGIQGWFRITPMCEWETADAVWGFVGDDDGGGYQYDIMAETMDTLAKTVSPRAAGLKRTRATLRRLGFK